MRGQCEPTLDKLIVSPSCTRPLREGYNNPGNVQFGCKDECLLKLKLTSFCWNQHKSWTMELNFFVKSQNQNLEKMFMKIGSGSLGHKGNFFTKVN